MNRPDLRMFWKVGTRYLTNGISTIKIGTIVHM